MKERQTSFTMNNSRRTSTYRPNSSTKNSKKPLKYNINSSISELYPPITFTMPSNKKPSRIGLQITREELYEENMHLKKNINKMRRELDEVKNKLFKKGLELNKKEKIIREVNNQNVTEYTHEINLEKAKESALLTMCKEKYILMKKDFEKKCEENEILKANIKITKLKEYQIQIDVLKKEMEKLRTLYHNSQANYENSLKELNQMKNIKAEFAQQHSIINSLNKKCQDLSSEMNYISEENEFLKNQISKNQEIQKKLKNNNLKLKISNKKYMDIKKKKEDSVLVNTDNLRKLQNLKKDLAEYKQLYARQKEQYDNLVKKGNSFNPSEKKIVSIKPFNYEEVKKIENNKNEDNQSQLYKSLLEEARIKNKILENFLRENDIDPEQVLKGKGYDGIINVNTNQNILKSKEKFSKYSADNSTNTKDATSIGTKENAESKNNLNNTQSNFDNNNPSKKNINTTNKENDKTNINKEKKEEEEKINEIIQDEVKDKDKDNDKDKEKEKEKEKETDNLVTHENQDTVKMTESQNSDFNTQDLQLKETQILALLHTFVKNLEANHLTKEVLINKIKEISLLFDNREEATKEEFLEPFVELFINSMKVTQSTDIKLINEFFNKFIDDLEGDTNKFFLELIDIFENIVDYTLVENEEEVLNAITLELQPYKDELKVKLEKYENGIITFDNLRKVIEELNISLTDDYTEFLIYKMKEKVPENSSIFDLNYKIVLELLDRNINNDKNKEEEKKIKEEENESKDNYDEDEMNIKMSNKLSELKQALRDNNSSLENECKDKVQTYEEDNEKKIRGINKDIFFDVMKKYNIDIEDKVKEAIFDLFKIENDIIIESESELFLLDYDKLCSIL